MKTPFVTALVQELAPVLGLKVFVEPQWQRLGEIEFPDGRKHFFLRTDLGVNSSSSAGLAKDKAFSQVMLKRSGIKTPDGRAFSSDRMNAMAGMENGIEKAVNYAREIGYPVYVKPNDLDYGEQVVKVYSASELRSVSMYIFEKTDTLLVERVCPGRDYRVVVYNGKVEVVYERVPLNVVGDGQSTIEALAHARVADLQSRGKIRKDFDADNITILKVLQRNRLDRKDVPQMGDRIRLLENASLSTGGEAVDLTNAIHSGFVELAIRANASVGLKFSGVDFLAQDLTKAPNEQDYVVLELNSNPALGMYYDLGAAQRLTVEKVYRKLLLDLMRP